MNGYLDWAATSPIMESALKVYNETCQEYFANPSSIHSSGRKARQLLDNCRISVSNNLQCSPSQVIFTSGGTESNFMVLTSMLRKKRKGTIIISSIEHPSISEYESLYREMGFTVKMVRTRDRYLDIDHLGSLLDSDTLLVSSMLVNNVTGALQPIGEAVKIVREYEKQLGRKIHFHTDAVQALGKIHFDLTDIDVDTASFSAHKLQGPRGIGILYMKQPIMPLLLGGGQESGYRSGTESLASIHAMTHALEQYMDHFQEHTIHMQKLYSILAQNVLLHPDLYVPMHPEEPKDQSPYIITFSCRGIPSEVVTRVMDDKGFFISSGSACSSKDRRKRERVLVNMGFSQKIVSSAIRVSFGALTTVADVETFCDTLNTEVRLLHKMLGKR